MRNPLDPDVWLTEKHRFDMPGERADIRLGVHATTSFDAALAYAVHKASQEGDLSGGEQNCGIVFELDMQGLEPLPEADSLIASKDEEVVLSELGQVIDTSDPPEKVARDFLNLEALDDAEYCETRQWFEAYWNLHVWNASPWIILSVLESLAEDDPEEFYHVLCRAFENEGFPLELWAAAIGQYRYMSSVGFDRLLRVWAVHPVEPDLVEWDDEEVAEGCPSVFSEDYVEAPPSVLIWDSGRKNRDPMFHGTDVSRARNAFPEVVIESLWPYGQPEGVGPA